MKILHAALFLMALTAPSLARAGTFTILSPTDWHVSNGLVSADFNPNNQSFTKLTVTLAGKPYTFVNVAAPLPTIYDHGAPTPALYTQPISESLDYRPPHTAAHTLGSDYIDIFTTTRQDPAHSLQVEHHYLFKDNDPGIHFFAVLNQPATPKPVTQFATGYTAKFIIDSLLHYYEVNPGPYSLGTFITTQPHNAIQHFASNETYDAGKTHPRNVQRETIDFTGLANPDGSPVASIQTYQLDNGVSGKIVRPFTTKYDWQAYHQLLVATGVYNDKVAAWLVYTSGHETQTSGPTGQDLIANNAGPFIQICFASDHNGDVSFNLPANVATRRVLGPVYLRFNAFDSAHTTPAALYQDAADSATAFSNFYDSNQTMLAAGYTPTAQRSALSVSLTGPIPFSTEPYANVLVLADNGVNFNTNNVGYQYWDYLNPAGNGTLSRIIPGTYRLSYYQIGQWGELRADNIKIPPAQKLKIDNLHFTPENFGTAPPIFTIGTPDRSGHEFLYAHDGPPNGPALRNYHSYDYWGDLVKNFSAPKVIYYATAVGNRPATNNINFIPFNQFKNFNPKMFAKPYNPEDTSQDGYKYLTAKSAPMIGDPAKHVADPWEFHFTTTAAQQNQGNFVILSVALAAAESDFIASLNGHPLTGHMFAKSHPAVRSGVSGRQHFMVFQWDKSLLAPAGTDNLLTCDVTQQYGVTYDALRLEIAPASAHPETTHFHDYEFITAGTDVRPNDTLPTSQAEPRRGGA